MVSFLKTSANGEVNHKVQERRNTAGSYQCPPPSNSKCRTQTPSCKIRLSCCVRRCVSSRSCCYSRFGLGFCARPAWTFWDARLASAATYHGRGRRRGSHHRREKICVWKILRRASLHPGRLLVCVCSTSQALISAWRCGYSRRSSWGWSNGCERVEVKQTSGTTGSSGWTWTRWRTLERRF